MTRPLLPLYPLPLVFAEEFIAVANGHALHVRQSGHAQGRVALVLHGGPGSGCSPLLARFFDPARFRVVCLDQRGAGRSLPAGDTAHNTTAHLLADLRLLRAHLGIDRWLVVGGSWGATLALAHALDAPEAVAGLLLRGVFLTRSEDIDAFFAAAESTCPHTWARWRQRAAAGGVSLLDALAARLQDDSAAWRRKAARDWWLAERNLSQASASASAALSDAAMLDALVPRYRIQAHYLRHRCWLDAPPLLDRCAALPRVPTLLLHGSRDCVCAPAGAAVLHARLPHAGLRWVDEAGHDPVHPAMVDAMVRALDAYAESGTFDVVAGMP